MVRVKPESWVPDAGIELEPNASIIVRSSVSTAVLAGPGAGKTELLAQRASFLLLTGACQQPKRILALCFKVDATANLKERVRKRCGVELSEQFDCYTFHGFAKSVLDRFMLTLSQEDRPDANYDLGSPSKWPYRIKFAELIPLATQIVEGNAGVRRALRLTYAHVFLDEFQDCTDSQYDFFKAIFYNTEAVVTAVGDTKQSIMRWAKALPGVFGKFAHDFGACSRSLYRNHRSLARLQQLQHTVILRMDPSSAGVRPSGDEGEILLFEYEKDSEEAVDIAGRIKARIAEGVSPSEIAILVRVKGPAYTKPLRMSLRDLEIRYRDETSNLQDTLSEPVAKLIISLVKALTRTRSPDSWTALMDVVYAAHGMIGDDTAREHELIRMTESSLLQFREQLDNGSKDIGVIKDAVNWVLTQLIGLDRIRAIWPAYRKGSWLKTVVSATRKALESAREQTSDWAQAVDLLEGKDAVRIMTIHKCKGLEFDTAIVMAVDDQAYFGMRSGDEEKIEEEWACFFVAISRAKRSLWVTFSASREKVRDVRRSRELVNGFYECLNSELES